MRLTVTTKFPFSKAALLALSPTDKQYEVHDTKEPGLLCRIYPTGAKTLVFYRKVNRRNKRIKIGNLRDTSVEYARNVTATLRQKYSMAKHQPETTADNSITLKLLYEKYYNEYAVLHTKRPGDTKQMFELHVFKKLGSNRISHLSKQILKDLHRTLGSKIGEQQSNRVLDMISAVINYGIREELINVNNPCKGIKRFKRVSRDRFLSTNELTLFFEALGKEEQLYQDFFLLSIFIGARKSTMLAMRFEEINFQLKGWRLGHDKTKNGDVNLSPLSDEALKILERRKSENDQHEYPSPFVFPGSGKTGHLKDPKKAFARIKRAMSVPDIRIHDLRRTLGSYMAINNSSLPIIAKALNHKSTASTEIYARLAFDPVRAAVNEASESILQRKKEQITIFAYKFRAQTFHVDYSKKPVIQPQVLRYSMGKAIN
jgi:integrase